MKGGRGEKKVVHKVNPDSAEEKSARGLHYFEKVKKEIVARCDSRN